MAEFRRMKTYSFQTNEQHGRRIARKLGGKGSGNFGHGGLDNVHGGSSPGGGGKSNKKLQPKELDRLLPIKQKTVTAMDKGTPRIYTKKDENSEWRESLTGAKITNPGSIEILEAKAKESHVPASKLVASLFYAEDNFIRVENRSIPENTVLNKMKERGLVEKIFIDNPYDKNDKEKWEVWRLKDRDQ